MMEYMKSARTIIVTSALFALAFAPLLGTGLAAAASATSAKGEVCQGLGEASGNCTAGQNSELNTAMTNALNVLSVIAGFTAIVMIIISGIRFMTAAGDPSGIASARTSLIYALVGLVVVAMAQFIVHFVLGRTGVVK
jgi:Type IV secretion system pilin